MYSLLDNFSGTATTALTSHTADTGQTWTLHSDSHYTGSTVPKIDSANRLRHVDAVFDTLCYASGSPIVDVVLTAVIKCYTLPGGLAILAPAFRIDTGSTAIFYTVWFQATGSSGTLQLYKYASGASSGVTVGSAYNFTVTAGQSYSLVVRNVGPTIRVSLDGTERISLSDTGIAAAGAVGLLTYATDADGAGIAVDSFTVTDAYVVTRVTTGGADLLVLAPPAYDGGTATGMVLLHHGAGGDREFWLDNTYMPGLRSQLLQDGYLLAGVSGGSAAWGNDASLTLYGTAYTYILANWNVSNTVINGQSMGGIGSLRSLRDSATFPRVKGFFGTYPVCDILAEYDDDISNAAVNDVYSGAILTAWSAADRTALVAAISGKNPTALSAGGYPDIRYKFWASASDTVVLKTHHTDAFSTLLGGTTTVANDVVATSGDHGDASNFDAPTISTFVAAALADPDLVNTTPETPANLAVVASGAAINITFDRSTDYAEFDDLSYYIYRSTDNSTYAELTHFADGASPSYSDTTVVANTTYYYKVFASSVEFGESATSSEQHTTSNNVPGAPVLLSENVEEGSTGIQVAPTAPASDGGSAIIAYQFWHNRNSAGFVLVGTVLAANIANHFLDNLQITGDTVAEKVRCYNAVGFSAYSATRTVTSQGPDSLPVIGGARMSMGMGMGM